MSRLEFLIEFPPGLVPRVRNFAEDLFRQLSRAGIGTVADIDGVTQRVVVRAASSRHLGAVSQQIRKTVARHLFAGQTSVTRTKQETAV